MNIASASHGFDQDRSVSNGRGGDTRPPRRNRRRALAYLGLLIPLIIASLTGSSLLGPSSGGTANGTSTHGRSLATSTSIGKYQAAKDKVQAATPQAPTPTLTVMAATTSLASNGPTAGTPVPHYKWLLNLDNTGNAEQGKDDPRCHPLNPNGTVNTSFPDGPSGVQGVAQQPPYGVQPFDAHGTTVYDGGGLFSFPNPATEGCPWQSLHYENASPVISEGDDTTWNSSLALPAFDGAHGLPPGKYLVSVTSEGYEIGGAHFTICPTNDDPSCQTPPAGGSAATGPGVVVVGLNPFPLPLGTIKARAYADIAPTTGAWQETDPPLQGFRAKISDYDGLLSVDYYGNPLCTQYKTDPLSGLVILDAKGNPQPQDSSWYGSAADTNKPSTPGNCLTGEGGIVNIPNLWPNRYSVDMVPPQSQQTRADTQYVKTQDWVQDETLEGNHDFDVWLEPNDTGLDAEQVVAGEPQPYVNFGYVPQINALPSGTVDGGSSVTYGPTTVTDTQVNWAADQWKGATISAGHATGVVTGNSANVITLAAPWDPGMPSAGMAFSLQTAYGYVPPPAAGEVIQDAGLGVTYNAAILFDETANWSPNQWVGATVTAGSSTGVVLSNTGNTIYLKSAWSPSQPADGTAYVIAGAGVPTGEVKGQIMGSNNYVPGLNGIPGNGGNSGFSGIKLDRPVKGGWVALSNIDLAGDGQTVYAGPTDANGNFDIHNVPDGDYLLATWDQPQDYALDQFNVTVSHGQLVDTGALPLLMWFSRINGKVCLDLNGNSRCDPGEPGVPQFLMQMLNRTNNTYEQGQNLAKTDLNGNYEFTENYPLGQFTTEQFFNTRYKTTGLTYQACNDPQEHTIVSPFVDVQVLGVIGECGRIDIAVQPYNPSNGFAASGDNGGIVATMLNDSIRVTYPARQNIQFDHLTGMPGFQSDLYDPTTSAPDPNNPVGCFPYPNNTPPANGTECKDVNSAAAAAAGASGGWVDANGFVHNKDGSYHTVQPSPLNRCSAVMPTTWPISPSTCDLNQNATLASGDQPTQSYITEHSGPPINCMPLDANGNTYGNSTQNSVPVPTTNGGNGTSVYNPANYNPRCIESSISGTAVGGGTDNNPNFIASHYNAATAAGGSTAPCAVGAAASGCVPLHAIQTVDGNYTLDATDSSLCASGPSGPIFTNQPGCYQGHPGDFVVYYNVPTDNVLKDSATGKYDQPLYTVSTEEDINIFSGDQFVSQNADYSQVTWPPHADAANQAPVGQYQENPGTSSPGPDPQCAGAAHIVNVTNPDFLALGGSPFQNDARNLCYAKLIHVEAGQSVAPNFHFHTANDVPIPGKFSGYIVDDVSASTDKKSTNLGEVSGIAGAPIGIYDWAGQLLDTSTSDYNGQYEILMPSTQMSNCLNPAGVCANVYRFVGNDPGQPPNPNTNYIPAYTTISANFQTWPGQFLASDTAPNKTISNLEAPGTTFQYPPACNPAINAPQLFAVNRPYVVKNDGNAGHPVIESNPTLTITGLGFGINRGTGHVNLSGYAPNLPVVSWSDRQIQVTIPTSGNGALSPGARQLTITNDSGLSSAKGITFHVLGNGYNPTVLAVGPETDARTFPTTPGVSKPAGSVTSNAVASSYTNTSATDSTASLPVNEFGGGTIFGTGPSGPTTAAVQSNTATTITLGPAGWSNGTPNNGSSFIVSPPFAITSNAATTTYNAGSRTLTDPNINLTPNAFAGAIVTVADPGLPSGGNDYATYARIASNTAHSVRITNDGWTDGDPLQHAAFTIWPQQFRFSAIQDALETASAHVTPAMPDPGLPDPTGVDPISRALVIVYPANPSPWSPIGTYYENPVIHSPVKVQGVGPGGIYADGTVAQGTKVSGAYYWSTNTLPDATGANADEFGNIEGREPTTGPGANEPYVAQWLNLVENILEQTSLNPNVAAPADPNGWDGLREETEAETFFVVAKATGPLAYTSGYQAGIDGVNVTGGDQKDFPGNINEAFGIHTAQLPEGGNTDETPGTLPVQGGGIFINAYADYFHITNDLIQGNSGSYGGAIRVGNPYTTYSTPALGPQGDLAGGIFSAGEDDGYGETTTGLVIANNQIIGNGGTNLAGAVGLFDGTNGYQVTHNVICGNYSLEYGGGVSHFGLSGGESQPSTSTFTSNSATDTQLPAKQNQYVGFTIVARNNAGAVTTATVASNSYPSLRITGAGWSNGTPKQRSRFLIWASGNSIDHNRIFLNGSGDEAGGLMIAGETPVAPTNSPEIGVFGGTLSNGSGPVTVDSNMIASNIADDDGGGVRYLMAGAAPQRLINNLITNNVSAHEGGGVSIDDSPNVLIDHDTIARNVTTATATTSDGAPAPAGISTQLNSDQLQATLAAGSARYSNPTITNDMIWDNRAGSWSSAGVAGIGLTGDTTPINVWDVGTVDQSGFLAPHHSLLDTPTNAIEGCTGCTPNGNPNASGNYIGQNPTFTSPFVTQIDVLQIRTYFRFRPSAIVSITLPSDAFGNYASPYNTANAQHNPGLGAVIPGGLQ